MARLRVAAAAALTAALTAASPAPAAECADNPACYVPNDPLFHHQWYLQNDAETIAPPGAAAPVPGVDVGAPFAWRLQRDTPVKIAVIDSGHDQLHEDLLQQQDEQYFVLAGTTPNDEIGHGTAVTGIIAAAQDNNLGIAGLAYHSRVIGIKAVLNPTQPATCKTVSDGIDTALTTEAKVIVIAAGATQTCDDLLAAVTRADDAGVLVVASAGNTGDQTPIYPAAYDEHVLAVAATDNGDHRAPFSTYGPWVDLAAPGVGILSTAPRDATGVSQYAYENGTSFAAPQVAAAAAMAWRTVSDDNGDGQLDEEVAERLRRTATPIPGEPGLGAGRLDVCRAIAPAADCDAGPPAPPAPAPAPAAARSKTPGLAVDPAVGWRDALKLHVRCSSACNVRASGELIVSGSPRSLRGARRTLAAGESATLRMTVRAAVRKGVARALKAHRRVTADVLVVATTPAGGRSEKALTARLARR